MTRFLCACDRAVRNDAALVNLVRCLRIRAIHAYSAASSWCCPAYRLESVCVRIVCAQLHKRDFRSTI